LTIESVGYATLGRVARFNNRRPLDTIGNISLLNLTRATVIAMKVDDELKQLIDAERVSIGLARRYQQAC
jgi:hypothetical protein